MTSTPFFVSATGFHRRERPWNTWNFYAKKYPERRFKKIIKPSETRWSFYKDVLASVMSQTDETEQFLKHDRDFIATRQRLFPFPGALVQPSMDFFTNWFIHSLFTFALSILKKISCVSDSLQEQYTILPVVWEKIFSMKQTFNQFHEQMMNGIFGEFDFVCQLCDFERKSFLDIMECL